MRARRGWRRGCGRYGDGDVSVNFHPLIDFLFGWGRNFSTKEVYLKSLVESVVDLNQPIVTRMLLTSKIETEVDDV